MLRWVPEDVRSSIRLLWRSRGFALAALLSMAIAVGMNSTVFSLVRGVLLQPLPYAEPERLFAVVTQTKLGLGGMSVPDLRDLAASASSFEALALWRTEPFTITGGGSPEVVRGGAVSAGYFALLRIRPLLGRTFVAAEEAAGGHRVVLLGEGLWRRRYQADPRIVGGVVHLNREPYTVVGVLSEALAPPDATIQPASQLWVPVQYQPWEPTTRVGRLFFATGRLKPGVSVERAQAELTGLGARLQQAYPETNKDVAFVLRPLAAAMTARVRVLSLLLFGAVGLILLIGCANVANLTLARSLTRTRDLAIRAALGATPRRLLRLWIVESLVLCLLSGAVAAVLAVAGVRVFRHLLGDRLRTFAPVGVDLTVLAFTFAIATVAAVAVGLAPAIRTWRLDLSDVLKGAGGRGATLGRGHTRGQYVLIVSQIAIVCVLWIGAGLMITSVRRLYQVDPGFDARNLLAVELALPATKYRTPEQVNAFFERLTARVQAIPGVQSVAAVTMPPLSGRDTDRYFVVEGRPAPAAGAVPLASFRSAGPGYFQVMKVPILAGRDFDDRDRPGRPNAAIINQALKDRYFPGENPIGQRFRRGLPGTTMPLLEIVGVVGNVRHRGLDDEARPEFYVSYLQDERREMFLMIRGVADPRPLVPAIREAVARIDSEQPISALQTVAQLMDVSAGARRLLATLLGVFAGLALLLATVGVYSVVSTLASSRAREFGIRLAYGARPADIFALVLRRGMTLMAIGLAAGLGLSLLLGDLLASFLFEVQATDPATYALVAALLGTVGLVANLAPARRATRIDPIANLRAE